MNTNLQKISVKSRIISQNNMAYIPEDSKNAVSCS